MRPWVVVDLDMYSRPPILSLFVENIGRTVARDVSISFDPPLTSTFDDAARVKTKKGELALFTSVLPTLPPGKRIETIFDHGPDRYEAGLDDRYMVTVTYVGQVPGAKPRRYVDEYVIDLSVLWGLEYVTPRGIADLHDRIRDIHGELKKMTNSGQGVFVKTRADVQREREEWERWREERRAREADKP